MVETERCVCFACCTSRPHTPSAKGGCRGCLCDLQPPRQKQRVRVRVATIPQPYKDIDELLQSAGPLAYERMIRDARPAAAWVIDNVDDLGCDLTTAEGRQESVDMLVDYLVSLPALERVEYARRLAERLEVAERDLRLALNEAYLERHPRRRYQPESESRASQSSVLPATAPTVDAADFDV